MKDEKTMGRSSLSSTSALAWLAYAALLNAPFLLCHPAWPAIEWPLARSLAVGLVLLVLPGLPWTGLIAGRGGRAKGTVHFCGLLPQKSGQSPRCMAVDRRACRCSCCWRCLPSSA